MLEGQSVARRHVHLPAGTDTELQLLQQGGQEEEDLPPGDELPDAPPLPQAEDQHLLPVLFVHLGPFGVEETLRVENVWVLPKFPGVEKVRC